MTDWDLLMPGVDLTAVGATGVDVALFLELLKLLWMGCTPYQSYVCSSD